MNASCASGIFLGACVYQCLLTHPSPPRAVPRAFRRTRVALCGGGVWALPVVRPYGRSAGIPRRVDLHSKRARGCQCMLTIEASVLVPFDAGVVSLSPDTIASACGSHSMTLVVLMCASAAASAGPRARFDFPLGRPSQAHCSAHDVHTS